MAEVQGFEDFVNMLSECPLALIAYAVGKRRVQTTEESVQMW